MLPAISNGGGQCFIAPDVVKVPTPGGPVPTPLVNIAMYAQSKGGTLCKRIKLVGKKAATTKTEISMSSGDEAGTAGGGVISNRFKGPAKVKRGSPNVKLEGNPGCILTSMIGQNGVANANCPAGNTVAPGNPKVKWKS